MLAGVCVFGFRFPLFVLFSVSILFVWSLFSPVRILDIGKRLDVESVRVHKKLGATGATGA